MLGLMIILAACGGGSPNSTTGTNGTSSPHATNTAPSSGSGNIPTKSAVSFTASGGLTGTYTISDNNTASNYAKKAFGIVVQNQSWVFTLSYTSDYTGPGTYTIKFAPITGSVVFSSVDGTKRWELDPPSSCQLTVTGDTALNAEGTQYHEVKGSFSCPSLASQSSSPLKLTNGQFDIVALVV